MAKTRLSKLQKWILKRCLKDLFVYRDEAREFYGKKFGENPNQWDAVCDYNNEGIVVLEREHKDVNDYEPCDFVNGLGEKWGGWKPKKGLCSNRSIEASVSRSFNQLIKFDLLTNPDHFRKHFLTESGFLNVNKFQDSRTVNTYVGYVQAVNKLNQEEAEHYKKLVKDISKIGVPK